MLHRGSRSKEWKILWLLQGAVPRCDFHSGDAETDAILRSKSAHSLRAHLYSGPAGLPAACWLRREDLSWWATHLVPLSSFKMLMLDVIIKWCRCNFMLIIVIVFVQVCIYISAFSWNIMFSSTSLARIVSFWETAKTLKEMIHISPLKGFIMGAKHDRALS